MEYKFEKSNIAFYGWHPFLTLSNLNPIPLSEFSEYFVNKKYFTHTFLETDPPYNPFFIAPKKHLVLKASLTFSFLTPLSSFEYTLFLGQCQQNFDMLRPVSFLPRFIPNLTSTEIVPSRGMLREDEVIQFAHFTTPPFIATPN